MASIVDIREYDYTTVYSLEDGGVGRLRTIWSFGSETRHLLEESQDLGTKDYVRVMGRLKVINGDNHLIAEHIRPILDMHEIFFHCLEAIVTFVSNQRTSQSAPPAQLTAQVTSQSPPNMQRRATQTNSRAEDILTTQEPAGLDPDTTLEELERMALVDYHTNEDLHGLDLFQTPNSSFPPSPSRPLPSLSTDPPSETNNQPALVLDPYSSLSLLQRDIIIQIHHNAPHFPDGIPITTMYRLVDRLTASESEIREAIDDLMDCGHLYLTIDQNLKIVD